MAETGASGATGDLVPARMAPRPGSECVTILRQCLEANIVIHPQQSLGFALQWAAKVTSSF